MSERDPRLYCDDILDSGNAILKFVEGLTFESFCADRKTYSAVIREFEIIGEAVGKLPESFRKRRPDVEWQDIKDFRNLLSHENAQRAHSPLLAAGLASEIKNGKNSLHLGDSL